MLIWLVNGVVFFILLISFSLFLWVDFFLCLFVLIRILLYLLYWVVIWVWFVKVCDFFIIDFFRLFGFVVLKSFLIFLMRCFIFKFVGIWEFIFLVVFINNLYIVLCVDCKLYDDCWWYKNFNIFNVYLLWLLCVLNICIMYLKVVINLFLLGILIILRNFR